MASTFSIKSKSYDGRYLELKLVQTPDIGTNKSTVNWTLTAAEGSTNYYSTGPTTAKLGDKQLCYYPRKSYSTHAFPTGPKGATDSGTVIVDHNTDGTCTLPVSLTTAIYGSTSHTVSEEWTLDAIPRASKIADAEDVILGNSCSVKWTPNSATFRFKLKFSFGDWNYTTGAIHPNKTGSYTYTEYTIPLEEIAERITEGDSGEMAVTLTTYADSGCKNTAGSDSKTFKVTVPSNDLTRPELIMLLRPVSPIDGLYIQGISKVQAEMNVAGKLGTQVRDSNMIAEGKKYTAPYLSNCLQSAGEQEIIGEATDERGITAIVKQMITVLPCYKPRLTEVAAYRCNSAGEAAEDGEYLRIEASRDYAPVVAEGVQRNFCTIRYRYRTERAEGYSGYITILEAEEADNSVITAPLLNGTMDKALAYAVEISAVDTVGQETMVTVSIPSEAVFRHKRPGGRGLGLGGYCEEDDLLDVYWNQRVRKNLQVDGYISGAYIRTVDPKGTASFTVQSRWDAFNTSASGRQVVSIFGYAGSTLISGVAGLRENKDALWSGSGAVTVTAGEKGQFIFTLPEQGNETLVLISTHKISIT